MTSDTPTNTATFRDWPHRIIRRSDTVRPLPPHTRSLADLTVEVGGRSLSVSDCMTRCRTAGVLILKDGEIALERYGMRSGPETPWTARAWTMRRPGPLSGRSAHIDRPVTCTGDASMISQSGTASGWSSRLPVRGRRLPGVGRSFIP